METGSKSDMATDVTLLILSMQNVEFKFKDITHITVQTLRSVQLYKLKCKWQTETIYVTGQMFKPVNNLHYVTVISINLTQQNYTTEVNDHLTSLTDGN